MFTLNYKTIFRNLLFIFIYFIYTTNAICPSNFIKNENNCISNEKGFSKLKIIYCNFINSTSHKHSIISIIKNPYDNFSTISYPKYDNGANTFIDILPNYSETDEETCMKKVPQLKFQSIFKIQIVDLYKTQKKYLCDENYKYEFFYLEGVSPCQYTSYDYYYAPILSLNTFICPETETDDFTNKLVIGANIQCPSNAIYSQSIELGAKTSFPDTCSMICSHGNCVEGKCECYPNWSGSTCNVKTCVENTDCLEISKNNVCTNSTCQCKHGFIENNGICIDENECITKKPCNLNTSICINTDESYKCECKEGYKKYGTENVTSGSVDEIHHCLHTASKVNEGTYICNDKLQTCQCKSGFTFSNSDCLDVDECTLKSTECPKNSVCNNLIGSYKCKCLNGHILFEGGCIPFPNIQNIKADPLIKGLITMYIESDINYSNIFKGFSVVNGETTATQCKNITYQYNVTNSKITCNLELGLNYNGHSFQTVLVDDTVKELKSHLSIPFIKSIEKSTTAGGIVKIVVNYYDNFTLGGIDKIEIKVNNVPVEIKSIKKNTISIAIERGSGKHIPLSLVINDEISTDYELFQYQEPFIENYTTISIETGGYITIYGNNFGDDQKSIQVFLRDKQDKVSIECTDLTLVNVDKILKCYMPSLSNISSIINDVNNNNDTQKLIWVKVNNLFSKDWIYFYYNQADTSYNCNASTTCSGHGTCLYGQCICNQGWSGPNCDVPVLLLHDEDGDGINDFVPILEDFNSKVPTQKIKTKNGTIFLFGIKSLIEYSPDGEIVEQVELAIQADWVVGETVNDPEFGMIKNYTTLLFNYAKINLTFVEPLTNRRIDSARFNSNYLPLEYGTVRLLININNWPFQSRTNYLDIIMESSTIIKDKLRPQCRTTSFTKYSQSPWIQTFSNDNTTLSGGNNTLLNNTIPISTVMSNVITNKFEKEEDSTEIIWYLTTNDYVSLYVQFINKIKIDNNIRTIKILKKTLFDNPGNNSVDVILRIPYFNQSVFVNPTDFKIITNEKPYINEQLTCIVEKPVDTNSQHSNKLIISSVCFIIGILALFTSVSALWYIIRKRKLSKSGGGSNGGGGGGGDNPKDLEKSNQIINNGASQPTTTAIESSNSLSPIST